MTDPNTEDKESDRRQQTMWCASESNRHMHMRSHGLGELVTVRQRNIEEDSFPEELHGKADALFLDLPRPWKVRSALRRPEAPACAHASCPTCSHHRAQRPLPGTFQPQPLHLGDVHVPMPSEPRTAFGFGSEMLKRRRWWCRLPGLRRRACGRTECSARLAPA